MPALPEYIREMVELSPVEDLLLYLIRQRFPTGVNIQSLIQLHQDFPLILVRRDAQFGDWDGDERWIDSADIILHTFCEDSADGANGDEDAALLAEAVRVTLRDAYVQQTVVPGRGHLTKAEMTSAPRRVTDWASATGPVQYADLPAGVWRYETLYHIQIRKPRAHLFAS